MGFPGFCVKRIGGVAAATGAISALAAVLAATALAAPGVSVTDCVVVPAGYAITFAGDGFAPTPLVTAIVTDPVGGTYYGGDSTTESGAFADLTLLVRGIPATVVFTAVAGESASVVVTECIARPATSEGCKKSGSDASGFFRNQGDCVSAVPAKPKAQPAPAPSKHP
jgi:hypothetical protein